jgi:hypothetical protein
MTELSKALDAFYAQTHKKPRKRKRRGACTSFMWMGVSPKNSRTHLSHALGVHTKQIPEAEEFARARGVPTEYDRVNGAAKITSRYHQKQLLKIKQLHNNDGGYGD